jgi:HlyD family secretion protein
MAVMKKYVLLPGLAAASFAGYLWLQARNPAAEPVPPGSVTARVERGPLRVEVSCTGRVVSRLDVEVKTRGSGVVIALPYDVNDVVHAGDLILALDPAQEERAVKHAQIALAAAELRLAQARQRAAATANNLPAVRLREETALAAARSNSRDALLKVEKLQRLLAKGLVSRSEVETAEAAALQAAAQQGAADARDKEFAAGETGLELQRQEITLAQSQIETALLDLASARSRLSELRVTAPMDGVVTRRTAQIGQLVASGMAGGSASMTISDLSRLFVLAAVDESDVGTVKAGQAALISADAFPGRRFEGRVVSVAARGQSVANIVSFEARIELLGAERLPLKPEMTANVRIVVEERDGVLLVPCRAISRSGERSRVLARGAVEDRPVDPGAGDGTRQEICRGLSEGEVVVVQPAAGSGGAPGEQGTARPGTRKKFWMLGS